MPLGELPVDQLPELAADLLNQKAAVIFSGGNAATRAAKLAMTTIPIVFTVADGPVRLRYVASFSRPGGSMTGLCLISGELGAKRLELARNFAPTGSAIAILTNPNNPAEVARDEQVAAHAAGQSILELKATTIAEVAHAFEGLVQQQAGVLLVTADACTKSIRSPVRDLRTSAVSRSAHLQRGHRHFKRCESNFALAGPQAFSASALLCMSLYFYRGSEIRYFRDVPRRAAWEMAL